MLVDQYRYERLRHAQAGASTVNAQWLDALRPNPLTDRRRHANNCHKSIEFAPFQRGMRPELVARNILALFDLQPIQELLSQARAE